MINRIINSVIAERQFSECPLTFKELHTIADTFVGVLLGIYHQRIEYPQTKDIGAEAPEEDNEVTESAVISLELSSVRGRTASAPPQRSPVTDARNPDYESVETLPTSKV